VDPEAIIKAYGADTARLFMLSDSPVDRDLDWSDAGIEGAWRYVNRLWRLVAEDKDALAPRDLPQPVSLSAKADAVHRAIHKTVAAVSNDLDRFHFNKAVARIRELTNLVEDLGRHAGGAPWVRRQAMEAAVLLLGPMMPHLAHEMWRELGYETLLADAPWPAFDATLLEDATVTVAVQVNGKLRGTLDIAVDSDAGDVERSALALAAVNKAVGGKSIRKVVVIPNRIVNVVL
jgi:leucyl-tRNA synthetase